MAASSNTKDVTKNGCEKANKQRSANFVAAEHAYNNSTTNTVEIRPMLMFFQVYTSLFISGV